MWNIGPTQLLIVLIIVLLLFGGKKLPDLARSLGRSLGEFKKGKEEGEKLSGDPIKNIVADIKADDVTKVTAPAADAPGGAETPKPEQAKAESPKT